MDFDSAVDELYARRKARDTFADFCRYLVPDEPPALHHVFLCGYLDKIISGEIRRLMVFMPPGTAKSTYTTKRFPPYYLGRFPNKAIICASYDSELSTEFGRQVRNYVSSEKHQAVFPGVKLSEDSRSKGQWATDAGGTYYAAGVGSAVTGRRGDCLTGDTKVITDDGVKNIKDIEIGTKSCYILSYDGKRPVFKKILAFASREAEGYLEIHTASGKVVKVTGNHRIYTSEGYKKASDIAEGEMLLSLVSERGFTDSFRLQEKRKAQRVGFLQPVMLDLQQQFRAWYETAKMQRMRYFDESKDKIALLLKNVQIAFYKTRKKGKSHSKTDRVQPLWDYISATLPYNKILFNGMQECWSCKIDDGRKQSAVAKWYEPATGAATFSKSVQDNATEDTRKRQSFLRNLLRYRKTACSSHKYESIRQQVEKFSHHVRALSSKITCSRSLEAEKDVVSVVKRIHKTETVYDIQVEETECFFADGVLVHNCGIIDDPVKGQSEADSQTVREATWKWYKSDFFSRLKPGASQLIIQTRWNEDDLSGRILGDSWDGNSGIYKGFDNQDWHVICLPAEAKEDDILGRKPGEWLWPDYYTPEVWKEIKSVQTNKETYWRTWNSLYQQNPQPDEGDFFKREWFEPHRYDLGKEPPIVPYGCGDYAVTKGGGDYTELGIGGFDSDYHLWLTDWWSGQVDPLDWMTAQLKLIKRHDIMHWTSEQGVIRRSVESSINARKKETIRNRTGRNFTMHWLPHIGDKAAKARAFQMMAMAGEVHIPRCQWGDELIDQLINFIPGANIRDDKVDVCGFFGRILDQVYGPAVIEKETKKEIDPYGFEEQQEMSWKTM